MERDLRLNWHALVEEARQRRKEQGLTQRRLAAIADVSAPTVSRFERAEKDIQLSSALAILEVLGLVEHEVLTFGEKSERYDWDRDAVLFTGVVDEQEVPCAVSGEALEDYFGARGHSKQARLKAFQEHRRAIENLARRKYTARQREADGSIVIRSADVG